jgi:nucleoside-diphosphate-sugar epimerase
MPVLHRPRLLVVGCGDVGMRVVRLLRGRFRILALSRSKQRLSELRAAGVVPLLGDLDEPPTLARLAGVADAVLHLAPPPTHGLEDPRTRQLLQVLGRRTPPKVLVYASTTGVYGDAQGALFDETRALAPANARAHRRVHAEQAVRRFGAQHSVRVVVLRVPGIYALDRDGGDPRERVRRSSPVLIEQDDVYTNHIHADDLARACVRALYQGWPMRAVHVCDDTDLRMGDYFDLVADTFGLPRPPRLTRAQAKDALGAMTLSFMSESRRLMNQRLKTELGLRLRYPTVVEGLASGLSAPP